MNSLPESIGDLENLQTLRLKGNNLSSLPESIGDLENLQTLNLHKNDFDSLPESLEQWIAEDNIDQIDNIIGETSIGNDLTASPSNSIIGLLNVIPNIFESVDNLSDLFYSLKTTNLQLGDFIFQLLEADHPSIVNLLDIVTQLNTNILTIILPFIELLGLIFGYDSNDSNDIRNFMLGTTSSLNSSNQSDSLQPDHTTGNPSLDILIANNLIMVLGSVSELLSYFKAGRSNLVKTVISAAKVGLSVFSFVVAQNKSRVISQHYSHVPSPNQGNDFFAAVFSFILDFQKESIAIRIITSSLSFFRDLTNLFIEVVNDLKPGIDLSALEDIVAVLTYYGSSLISLMKVVVDFSRISIDRSVSGVSLFNFAGVDSLGIGYLFSTVEHLVKVIRGFLKASPSEIFTDSIEKNLRLTFSMVDVVEDLLVIIYPDIIRYQ